MKRPSSRQRRLVILTLALLAFGIAFYGGSRYKDRPQRTPAISGVAIQPPSPLPELPDREATPLRREGLSGHWSLLMLDPQSGGTRTPALVRLLQVHNRLASSPELQKRLAYLYLPRRLERETQEAIEALDDNIHALTGDNGDTDEIFRRFGVEPERDNATLYLIDPQARLHALFTPDQDIATIAEDLTTLIATEL
jgi:cytochrome oxidase Cu insertion factor (SCO1/SenC/PrrC family)